MLSLPARFGGLGIAILSDTSQFEYENSCKLSHALSERIIQQRPEYDPETAPSIIVKNDISKARDEYYKSTLSRIRETMTREQLRGNDLAQFKGASSWLTSLPLKTENFVLNKREFFDALCLRYRWPVRYMPSVCPCGKSFSVDHAMTCLKGGYIHMKHNVVRDTVASLLDEVCPDVVTEPSLLPLSGETISTSANGADDARLDIAARGFWLREQRAFFDVRVFNPFAHSYLSQRLPSAFVTNEKEKKRAYNSRVINVEHGSFTPLVFTPYGGAGREAERFLKEVATNWHLSGIFQKAL